jgi:hypothetical protein
VTLILKKVREPLSHFTKTTNDQNAFFIPLVCGVVQAFLLNTTLLDELMHDRTYEHLGYFVFSCTLLCMLEHRLLNFPIAQRHSLCMFSFTDLPGEYNPVRDQLDKFPVDRHYLFTKII